ncbi:glutathione S-transferase [Aspergillus heterothallicus]
MPFGLLFTRPFNPRSLAILAIAKASNLDLEIRTIASSSEAPEEYLQFNPQGKIPTFLGSDGVVLTEAIAIAIYIASQDETSTLLGSSKFEYAEILRWMSFGVTEILPAQGGWFNPLIGRAPFDKPAIEKAKASTLFLLDIVDHHLRDRVYLVGHTLSVADLFLLGVVQGTFRVLLAPAWREQHSAITAWVQRVHSLSMVVDVAGAPVFADAEMEIVPAKM